MAIRTGNRPGSEILQKIAGILGIQAVVGGFRETPDLRDLSAESGFEIRIGILSPFRTPDPVQIRRLRRNAGLGSVDDFVTEQPSTRGWR